MLAYAVGFPALAEELEENMTNLTADEQGAEPGCLQFRSFVRASLRRCASSGG